MLFKQRVGVIEAELSSFIFENISTKKECKYIKNETLLQTCLILYLSIESISIINPLVFSLAIKVTFLFILR